MDDRLMAVSIAFGSKGGGLEPGAPVPLFATQVGGAIQGASRQHYFVSADGERFLMNVVLDEATTSPITLILNWKPRGTRQEQ